MIVTYVRDAAINNVLIKTENLVINTSLCDGAVGALPGNVFTWYGLLWTPWPTRLLAEMLNATVVLHLTFVRVYSVEVEDNDNSLKTFSVSCKFNKYYIFIYMHFKIIIFKKSYVHVFVRDQVLLHRVRVRRFGPVHGDVGPRHVHQADYRRFRRFY